MDARRLYSAPSDRTKGIICDQTIALAGVQTSQHYPQGPRDRKDAGVSQQPAYAAGRNHLRPLQVPLATRALFQMDQTALTNQSVLRHNRGRSEVANLDRGLSLRPRRHRKKRLQLEAPLYTLLRVLSLTLFEKMPILQALSQDRPRTETVDDANQLSLFAS